MRAWWKAKWRALRDPDQVHREIAEEMRFHVDMKAADLEKRGITAPEAHRQAEVQFGKGDRLREQGYEIRGGGLTEALWQDLRLAARRMRKFPARTAVLLATLALSFGLNAAIFRALKAIVIDPLGFPESGRLVILHQSGNTGSSGVSYPNFRDWRRSSQSFTSLSVFASTQSALMMPLPAERLNGAVVSASLFQTLRVRPLIGRDFEPRDDARGNHSVLISEALWRRRFGGDPAAIGRSCQFDGRAYQIIGVIRQKDVFPIQADGIDFWTTVAVDADPQVFGGSIPESRGYLRYDGVVARLQAGVAIENARAEMNVLAARIAREYPKSTSMSEVTITSALDHVIRNARQPLYLIFGAACCVLLVACANVALLLLVGNANRQREFAIRDALGAQPWRITRQLVSEYLLFSSVAGAAAILIAWGLLGVLRHFAPGDLPRLSEIQLNAETVLYVSLLSVLAGLVLGLLPANLRVLREQKTRATHRFGATLTIAQVTLGVVLTCCSSLLAHSFWKILSAPRGFDPQHVLTAQISLPPALYPQQSAKVRGYYADLLARLRSSPGIVSASMAQSVPLSGDDNSTVVKILGVDSGFEPETSLRFVDPSYFQTMKFGLVAGRMFTDRDTSARPDVVLVNAAFVRRFLAGRKPLGTQITLGWGGDAPKTIVGVVSDIRHFTLSSAPLPEAYVPHAQFPVSDMAILIRTSGEPLSVANSLRAAAAAVDPSVPPSRVQPLTSFLFLSSSLQGFLMALMGLFAAATMLLSAVGLFAVLSQTTAARMREFGIRMALGSRPAAVAGIVWRQAAMYVAAGLLAGFVLALPGMNLLRQWLYDTAAWDGLSFAATAVVFCMAAATGTWIPAQSAAMIAPAECLRSE